MIEITVDFVVILYQHRYCAGAVEYMTILNLVSELGLWHY